MKTFYGREDLLLRFESLCRKPTSSFVVCRARIDCSLLKNVHDSC